MMNSATEELELSILSQLDKLRNEWEQQYPARAEGGQVALTGFNHQFLLTLWKIVVKWKASDEANRQNLSKAHEVLAEAISDITEAGKVVTFTQVKRTLSEEALRKGLEELWLIFNLAFDCTPELAEHLQFVISGQYEGEENPEQVIRGWRTRSPEYPQEKLEIFKDRVYYQIVANPKEDLAAELQALARDEGSETTIARWLGYLLQIGSGFSPESISTFIWKELANDGSIEAFRATLARLFSLSHNRLCAIRETLGDHITFPRAKLLDLRASLLEKSITLLIGPSGSGKSALCRIGIQQDFKKNFDCLFLHASDIASFTESSDVIANRGLRRLDELLIARITQKPILVVIDDLSDVEDQHFDAVLNLLHNTLTASTSSNVRFVLVAHIDAKHRICEKISAQFGNNFVYADVELPQLPIEELESSEELPDSIIGLIQRHREFGPALNLKLIDWLVRSVQRDQVDVSAFRNDLDLLTWFWCSHVQDGQDFNALGQALTKIAEELANRFTPDLPCYFDSLIENETLRALVRRDCLRIVDGRIATTHRFVGDCARFYYLRANCREIESEHLVEWLQNPFWVQPIRWFALQLALESSAGETWQELLCEALEGDHLQLLDLLLDGAILSKQPGSVLQGCPDENLPFVIERLITRLLAIATEPYPFHADGFQSTPLRTRIAIQEQITGIPKPDLWEPVWHWLLSKTPETVIEASCIVFKAAEAWLNWSDYAEGFSLRSEVAEFILDLAQKLLLPDPAPKTQIIDHREIDEIIKLRQQGILPEPEPFRKRSYDLGGFRSNAFSCIVFSLKIIPERSTWFLRALAGREIVPANKLEPTEISSLLSRPGVGILESPYPQGPLGRVNHEFRRFMLKQGGLYLDCVVRIAPLLGVELLLALTIEPPRYRYESDEDFDSLEDDFGTEGSHDIDVVTFKFLPLISLLTANEELGISTISTLCKVATGRWHKLRWQRLHQGKTDQEESDAAILQSAMETDIDGIVLLVDGSRKYFQGGRKSLYWHRKLPSAPQIVACFLMTLENWLYNRPTMAAIEHSVSLILKHADTVALVGVLISFAKCYPNLLTNLLLPLVSSIQLFIWLEFEQIDQGQDYAFDSIGAQKLSKEDRQELYEFQKLQHRYNPLLQIALQLWLEEKIPPERASKILKDWDTYQIGLVPDVSQYRALRLRSWFDRANWNVIEDGKGSRTFQFINNLPDNPEVDAKAETALNNLRHYQIIMTCRNILDGKEGKTLELHNQLTELLSSEEQIKFFEETLEPQAFNNLMWAAIAVLLEPSSNALDQELETDLSNLAESFINLSFSLDNCSRCQAYNLDASAFIAHVSPKLIRGLKSDNSIGTAAFRCLISKRNESTSAFIRMWIREYGLEHPLTQRLVNAVPLISRLISLTRAFTYIKHIEKVAQPDRSYIVPRPEEIDYEISKREDSQIEEAWLILQNDFTEGRLQLVSITDSFGWIPEVLVQPIQQTPDWLQKRFIQNSLDWEFLTAAFIPILEMRLEGDEPREFFIGLFEQVFLAFLQEREKIYVEYKASQEKKQSSEQFYRYKSVRITLSQIQSRLLDSVILSHHGNALEKISNLIHLLKKSNLIDCILLENVIETLSYCIDDSNAAISGSSFKSQIALLIGNYLFEFKDQSTSDFRILGNISDAWEKLIELLLRKSKHSENIEISDQLLVQFFNRFEKVLFPYWSLRRKLYRVARASGYKQFRRSIFQAIVKHSDLLPDDRNDESESLVQVLAELWDSDYSWIISKQSRCQDLRALLGRLQEVDALGARSLADQVANSLSNSSN
ncbi:hypothetical protein ACQ4M4_12425 [Leptolyngbya sp. AN02str]|uniref:ATP-binding protein n=1 Tax=Leptolyngbya sp. AN02str TaxID=3423363 RepID=UPI003D31C51A